VKFDGIFLPTHGMPFTTETLKRHRYGSVFIETGTYMGDGIQTAIEAGFDTIHSIELDRELYQRAKSQHWTSNVTLWHGDSADVLPQILSSLEPGAKCTLWLDAHASGSLQGGKSGGSPVIHEIEAIANAPHVTCLIMIDDRRLFGSDEWGQITEYEAIEALQTVPTSYEISHEDGYIKDDILVCTPLESKHVSV